VSVSRSARFIEQLDEAQPSHCVADESLACFGQRALAATASAWQRPLLGRGLDAGYVYAVACPQIEKLDQIDLMSRNHAQRAPSGARLCAMHEIATSFLEERRSAVPVEDCAAGEEILEHDHISLRSET